MTPWLTPELLDRARRNPHLPGLELRTSELSDAGFTRRDLFRLAAGSVALIGGVSSASAALVFENNPQVDRPEPAYGTPTHAAVPLKLGEIPADFWNRPRTLKLQRHETSEVVEATYWQDGALNEAGYWQVCALLRDVRANRMTTMDPMLLDVLRGIQGYYEAWRWNRPIVITSGFRTEATNRALSKEGAAKNSMHLYGRAADCYMAGIAPSNIARLALHMQTGGVGFYPSRNFVHIDTGRRRYWKG